MIDPEELADLVGIARDYIACDGKPTRIDPACRLAALGAMGYNINDAAALAAELERQRALPFAEMLDRVTVFNDDDKKFFFLRTRADLSEEAAAAWTITLEDGSKIADTVPLYEIEIADYTTIDGVEYDIRRFFLPEDVSIPHGYHSVSFSVTDGEEKFDSIAMSLIMAPTRCYVPKDMAAGRKLWGVSSQLYSLRSKGNWGVGDFHDLKDLLKGVARRGGHFVGLNPLHAGYPANPDPDIVSPYSPSSRRWLNIVYIRVEDIPEYSRCAKAVKTVQSKSFASRLRALREREYVDYRQVLELKLKVIRIIFDSLSLTDRRSTRGRLFAAFMEEGGQSLIDMATYDALQSYLYAKGLNAWGWRQFPREFQNAASPFVTQWREEHIKDVNFYCYLQFIAREQLDAAFEAARKEGMLIGTYRDLAVGVAEGSCDVWSDVHDVYCGEASVGAPPDPLGPLGQSWGLAPMSPYRLKQQAYRPLIDLYRANMRACGALRIDHAAGLNRLWWVPPGDNATHGAYVAYPMHDMLAIVALESERNQCLIIAEDLGTIPMELRTALKQAGTYSYKLFFGEKTFDGGFIPPQHYEPQAMSALTTHDMATMVGWWGGHDLELGEKLGIYSAEQHARLLDERTRDKQRILESLHNLGAAGPDLPFDRRELPEMTPDLVLALQRHMCAGSCALYSSQLEDWIGVEKPVNVPGTFREYPNWRRKLTRSLEEIFSDQFVITLTSAMTAARVSKQ